MKRVFLFLGLLAVTAGLSAQVTTGSLLREMTGLTGLTIFPNPAYKTIQFSSYDRCARKPYRPGWFANADGFGGELIPGFEAVVKKPDAKGNGVYLMGEVKGPGAIVRTWTAMIGGRIQLFLDGAEKPVYDGPAHRFLQFPYQALWGGQKAVSAPGFHQRDAGYFPIPFAKGCRILWHGNIRAGHFYAIQVRCYGPGTRVRTFTGGDLTQEQRRITAASKALAAREAADRSVPKSGSAHQVELAPNEHKVLYESDSGPRVITRFAIKVKAADLQAALRNTVLRIYFDDAPSPQVESPLGDFFGAGPGVNPYWTLPMEVTPDGTMICRFAMPFLRGVRMDLENWSGAKVEVGANLVTKRYKWQEGRSMHFFAKWRADHGLLAKHRNEICDLPYLCARGKGVLVGVAAILMNPTRVPTPWGGWWGEGDEKIWVDDDKFPSTFGTGSEDYFNYSWSTPELFAHAYFSQPLTTGPGNRGYVTNNRWHIIDALPFKRGIFFFMELYTHITTPGLSYARLAYFYGFPGLRDDHVPLRPEVVKVPPIPAWTPMAALGTHGAIFYEGEALAREGQGTLKVVDRPICSAGKMLMWDGGAKGQKLTLTIPVAKAGKYRFGLVFLNSPRSGRVRVLINGKPICGRTKEYGLRVKHVENLRHYEGGLRIDLPAGEHKLEIEQLDEGCHLGLDFIWLK